MAADNEYPVFDGIAPSWADALVRLQADGAPLLDMKYIKSINTGATVEVGEVLVGGRVFKRTRGNSKQECSMTVYHEGWVGMLRNLMAAAPSRGNQKLISLGHFGIQYQYTPPGVGEIFETRIKGARVIGRTLNGAEGTEATTVDLTLSIIEIVDMIDGVECILL